ncbi:unnamed protein product [Fusarium graminearum]|uniref:Uncharacterized protein n=1 Tax=Gibberella zeae TaxID=5518 RepID=A0A4U9F121_GIBZA|nr:unnamed protein product [Fusarium graminearum]CZS83001.1 unnamed protein product [Fusarium graminearum]VTO88666.1 unnamed protein product [Fusarium graminearum]
MPAGLPAEYRAIVKGLSVDKLNELAQRWQYKRDEKIRSRDTAQEYFTNEATRKHQPWGQ